jgi:replication initiator protein RepSA
MVAGDLDAFELPDFSALGTGPLPPILLEVVERSADRYGRWEEQVAHTGYCCRPIRLRGRVEQMDKATGEVRCAYTTEGEPDGELLVACGSRKQSRCRSCSSWYQRDAFQVVAAGLRGGKGIPDSVGSHPKLFVTFTAPGFGAVHAHRPDGGKLRACRPRRRAAVCPHGVRLGCSVRHQLGDPLIGQPLCPACFDYEGQVIWNALAPLLWKRTTTYLPRELARRAGMTQKAFDAAVKVRFSKVGEYQLRGAIHFHAIVRLDGAPPKDDPSLVVPPPDWVSVELLEQAIRATRDRVSIVPNALAAMARGHLPVRWGTQIDIRPIHAGADMSEAVVAAYVAKYATKFSEGLGLPQDPIESDADVEAVKGSPHIRRLIMAAWVFGWRPEAKDLKLRDHAHGLGFGGHFMTKSRRYSTTMAALRAARRDYVRTRAGVAVDAWGRSEDEDQVDVLKQWAYAGWGYRTIGEAFLAASAAARAREERRTAREELRCRAA